MEILESIRWQKVSLGVLALVLASVLELEADHENPNNPGTAIYYIPGLPGHDELGRVIAVLGDLDRDGVKDFATSGSANNGSPEKPLSRIGHVDVYSGKTGTLLRRWYGTEEFEDWGLSLGALPDIDGDGVFELAAGTRKGKIDALSPVTGGVWFTLPPPADPDLGSSRFLRTADRDGDGVEEFVLVNMNFRRSYAGVGLVPGRVSLHSGRMGAVLWEHVPDPALRGLQRSVIEAGDFDGDGLQDVLVAAYPAEPGGGSPLLLLSGRTGEALNVFHVRDDMYSWGDRFVSLGDHDGNGFPEVVIAAWAFSLDPEWEDESGWVGLYALPEFRLVWSYYGRHQTVNASDGGEWLGSSLCAVGDLDRDGATDVLVGTNRGGTSGEPDRPLEPRFGRLYVHSGRSGEVLRVYEGHHGFRLDQVAGVGEFRSPFFKVLSPLDDVDGDGNLDFLVGRPSNSRSTVNPSPSGIIRAVRYRTGGARYVRGDANGDGRVNIADAARVVRSIFAAEPRGCEAAFDADGDAAVSAADAAYLLSFLFSTRRFSEPPPPFPECAPYDAVHPFRELPCADEGDCTRR